MRKNNTNRIIIFILIFLFCGISIYVASRAIKMSLNVDYDVSDNLTLVTNVEDGLEVNQYINSQGEVTVAGDKGYAVLIRHRDELNRVVLEQYLDENNDPVRRPGDYYAVSYSYSDNGRIITYLDGELNPVTITSGYSTINRTYPSSERSDFVDMYLDEDMNPVRNSVGCYGVAYYYEDNHNVEYVWLDENANPVNCKSGYSRVVRSYDSDNRVIREMYIGADNLPAANTNGEYGIAITYNEDNRRDRVTSLDPHGTPMVNYAGYATVAYTYNLYGNIDTERYYNLDDEPCTSGKSWYGKRHDGDRIYYLNIDGEDIISIDSILNNYPFLVSVFGILVCLIIILVPHKVKIGVIVLYFIFIMYETILYRVSHQPTANLELFWSYKQFLSNEDVRIEILNNIWLFVPYSLGLMSLVSKKKVLIPVLMLPLFIEVVQYVCGIGLAEWDDLISNGLGELIGAGVWFVCRSLQGGIIRREDS